MKNYLPISALLAALLLLPIYASAAKPDKKTHAAPQKKNSGSKKSAAKNSESAKKNSPAKSALPENILGGDFGNGPTYIKSDSLTIKPKDRIFTYEGGVEVKHQDLILSCASLQGVYDESNRIKALTAERDVLITKGAGIRAHGEKAVYDGETSIITLTENPELEQNGSILTADRIKIYMKENRSEAEGSVRMKMAEGAGAGLSDTLKIH